MLYRIPSSEAYIADCLSYVLVWKKRLQETITKLTFEESLCTFMTKIAKRHNEHSNLIKEVQVFMNFALRNQQASIKALEIQVRKMSIILHEKLSENLRCLTEIMLNTNDEMIYTYVEADIPSICCIDASQYVVSNLQNRTLFSKSTETDEVKDLEAYRSNAMPLRKALPRKEKDLGSFTLPYFINNMCFNKALADLGASISVMSYSTYTTLGLGDLIPTKLIVELIDRIMKQPKEIVENVLVGLHTAYPKESWVGGGEVSGLQSEEWGCKKLAGKKDDDEQYICIGVHG
uniref:Reverse transcriptase domain-containing protein n=1 Tax=Tanacetum cinerariifolium TaxID=118510 RepID=A0A6L2LS82_TANCI|nr:hypothetical protein [Tanacetum cinerariifolium]